MWRRAATSKAQQFKLKKRHGGKLAQRFKRWRTLCWRELKKVVRAQHCN